MASKGQGLSKEDTKTEHPLTAVVLCDAWGDEARWGPLVRRKRTDDEEYEEAEVGGEQRPWVRQLCTAPGEGRAPLLTRVFLQCLLPLLNTPLLAWTLESLAATGVEQVLIFVREGVEEVRAWLACVFCWPSLEKDAGKLIQFIV